MYIINLSMFLINRIVFYWLYRAWCSRCDGGRNIHKTIFLFISTQEWIAHNAIVKRQTTNNHNKYDCYNAKGWKARFFIQIFFGGNGGCLSGLCWMLWAIVCTLWAVTTWPSSYTTRLTITYAQCNWNTEILYKNLVKIHLLYLCMYIYIHMHVVL